MWLHLTNSKIVIKKKKELGFLNLSSEQEKY